MRQLTFTYLTFFILAAPLSAQDLSLDQILIPGTGWELVSEAHQFTEGPAADSAGDVYFTDVPKNTIYRILHATGEVKIFDDQAEKTSGLYIGAGDRLYACRNGGQKIVVYPQPGKDNQFEVLANQVTVNDLTVDFRGGVYFTDPKNQRVMYVDTGRRLHVVASGLHPNGICLSPLGGTLVVTEAQQPWLWAFRVEQDGLLSQQAPYYGVVQIPNTEEQPKSDGMTFDDSGRLYLASGAGLQVFDTTGRYSGTIQKPQPKFLSNVIFGGPEFNFLYVTCQDKVYRRKTQATGRPDWLPQP